MEVIAWKSAPMHHKELVVLATTGLLILFTLQPTLIQLQHLSQMLPMSLYISPSVKPVQVEVALDVPQSMPATFLHMVMDKLYQIHFKLSSQTLSTQLLLRYLLKFNMDG
uniref:Uncharacterized protein n=1 Tax=Opuntia streptacantha TaxID=393608 RepID=A0A7C9AFT1_OPUST